MILIADSGSTKTDWAFLSKDFSLQLSTEGINPSVMDEGSIRQLLEDELMAHAPEGVEDIYFYGAGCVSGEASLKMERIFLHFFSHATVHVYSDLLGAAKSVLGDEEGIVAILGTGSNSGYFDGSEIKQSVPPLGYILGDEGSGTWFGKRLLADYLRSIMPEELRVMFKKAYASIVEDPIQKVYRTAQPNKTLASMTPFLSEHRASNYCHELILEGLRLFVQRNICLYPNCQAGEIAFVGSLAWAFSKELEVVLGEKKRTLLRLEKEPMVGLIKYHFDKLETN